MDRKTGDGKGPRAVEYWNDPVYRYMSRLHRSAKAEGQRTEAERVDGLMQELVGGTMADEVYQELEAEARLARRARKVGGRRGRRPGRADQGMGEGPGVNTSDLKKRIFNPQVSQQNVIKALEALPSAERKATLDGLPPWLRRKLATYLRDRKH